MPKKNRLSTGPTVLAIDPGGTTGFADVGHRDFFSFEEPSFYEAAKNIDEMVKEFDAVVIERYTITQRTAQLSQQHEALMLIGIAQYACERDGTPLIMQMPATAKSFATNAKLKALGWYTGGKGHGDDAARHLLTYLATAKLLTNEQLLVLAEAK